MIEVGIAGFGAYVPRLRLQRSAVAAANSWFAPGLKGLAQGERAMANWDEDAITMAVEAARDCLGERDVATLILASTTAPFADRLNAGVVKEALDLPDNVATLDVSGSQRAGVSALIQGLAAAAMVERPVLCLGSDHRVARPASEGEMVGGDGAAALLLAPGAGIARFLGSHSVSADFVAHFRASGESFDYEWEARWLRDEGYGKLVPQAVSGALAAAGLDAGSVQAFIMPVAGRGVGTAMAKLCGIAAEAVVDPLVASIGICGTAHPLLMLVAALEAAKPGDRILVLGFGNGCDAAIFEATEAIRDFAPRLGLGGAIARRMPESNYIKFLTFNGHLALERGMRAEFDQKQSLTALWRQRRSVLGLVGGRCPRTGTVQFPRSDIGVESAPADAGTMEPYPLAERAARIVTFTADALTYSPDPPSYYGLIDFEGGGRMTAEFCDAVAEDVVVGKRMRMMFRVKAHDEQRHFIRYFWKAAPLLEDD